MLTKLMKDHIVVQSPFCGEIREVLIGSEYSPNVALAMDIRPTTAHYHKGFDEVYFLLDGSVVLQLHNPKSGETSEQALAANELCVISKGIHHKVSSSSARNRLCVITMPRFDPSDEHFSEVLSAH